MRIALVTRGDLFPTHHGAAVKIVRTAQALSLLGATVCIVTEDRDAYWRFEAGRRERVPYSPRFRAAQEWPGMNLGVRQAQRLCDLVGYPAEETFLYQPQFDPQWWARVLYVGRREQIQVYQAEFPGYALPCILAARLLGGQSAIVQHNVEYDRLQDVLGLSDDELRHVRALELWALQRVDHVIAVSVDDKQRMVQGGVPGDKITVLPHGVDTLSFQGPPRPYKRYAQGLDTDTPLLFFHGTLHYWPNTQAVRFIAEQLLPRLLRVRPDVVVCIAGMSPPTYYAHPNIRFLGPVEDLAGWIQSADVCLCPVPSGGGTRMKILEYFAAGKPTVSFTKGAEGIQAPDSVIARHDDPDAFTQAVLELLDDGKTRRAMGQAARAFVAWYDWGPIQQACLDLYAEGAGRGQDYNAWIRAQRDLGRAPQPPVRFERDVDPVEVHLPPREPSKPLTLLLLINRGCNLRCSFCDLWDNPENMPLSRVLTLLEQAAGIGTKTLVITGGEPFIHPDLFTVVKRARALGMAVNITTNGTLIEKRWEELRASGVNSLSVSLDGLSETHDRLRGQAGAFKRSMKGIRALREGAPEIALSVYFTANRENIGELVPVYELACELGAGFDFWPVNDAPDLALSSPEDHAAWEAAVAHLAAREERMAERRHFDQQSLRYHAGELSRVRCLGLVDQYGVTYTGELLPCCVWGAEGIAVGNVFERPLGELWRDPQVQAAREGLYTEGCGAGCFNHSLYEFTRSTGESFVVE